MGMGAELMGSWELMGMGAEHIGREFDQRRARHAAREEPEQAAVEVSGRRIADGVLAPVPIPVVQRELLTSGDAARGERAQRDERHPLTLVVPTSNSEVSRA